MQITFFPNAFFLKEIKKEEATNQPPEIAYKDLLTGQVTGQVKILEFCKQARSAKEIMNLLKLKHRESFYNNYLKPLLQDGLLLMTIPNKPKSKKQQYITKNS